MNNNDTNFLQRILPHLKPALMKGNKELLGIIEGLKDRSDGVGTAATALLGDLRCNHKGPIFDLEKGIDELKIAASCGNVNAIDALFRLYSIKEIQLPSFHFFSPGQTKRWKDSLGKLHQPDFWTSILPHLPAERREKHVRSLRKDLAKSTATAVKDLTKVSANPEEFGRSLEKLAAGLSDFASTLTDGQRATEHNPGSVSGKTME